MKNVHICSKSSASTKRNVNRIYAETTLIYEHNLNPLIIIPILVFSRGLLALLEDVSGVSGFCFGTCDFKPTFLRVLLTVRSLMLTPQTSPSAFLVWTVVWRQFGSVCNSIKRYIRAWLGVSALTSSSHIHSMLPTSNTTMIVIYQTFRQLHNKFIRYRLMLQL